ncbi:ABC transporter substrate-binding protein [Clostridium tagluense]|uniref:ABC transporter substrate-binding protein n=1 Tax=Clostridium tagluense TaxID=360422 RepID=UPI001CF2B0EF|nr:ABC transporter substrate-binding protein [Clostridium tagluense]MCB2298743.1 ABC transporter substrate-binding protein [Clostridium tagluense]
MNRKKILSIALAALMLSTVLVGCGNNNKTTNGAKTDVSQKTKAVKDKIVYALWSAPTGVFNPLLSDTQYDDAVLDLTYSSLLKFDKDLNLHCDLAESYTISPDNMTITFKLKKAAKWHDGQNLTTKDIAFTFTSMADKGYTGSRYGDVEKIKGAKAYHEGKSKSIEGIQIVDDYTIKFQFEEVYSPGLVNIGGMGIIPKHIWEKAPIATWKEKKDLLNKPVGSGPYKLVTFEPGQSVQLESFDGYYGNKAKTKKFIFKVSNQETAQAELANGTVDIADISTLKKKDIEGLKADKLDVVSYPNNKFQYMGFNLRQDKFKDVKVRQAFTYAIDRKLILDKLLEGNGKIVNTTIVPTSWAYPKADLLNSYDFNLNKSKSLLKEAGWNDKDANGTLENAKNEEFKVVLKYPVGDKSREQCASIIQKSLKDVGVKVELQSMEFPTLMDQVVGNHQFDLYLMANVLGSDPDPKPYWHSTSASDKKGEFAWNISSFKNAKADDLIQKGLSTLDTKERKKTYENFGILMNKELPWVYLYSQNVVKAYNPKLKNFNPTTYVDFLNVEDWYIEQ